MPAAEAQFVELLDALEELQSRLSVGLSYSDYGGYVGDIRVAYDRADVDAVEFDCVSEVGLPAEEALNDYVEAGSTWNDCITDLDCETESIDPQLQRRWSSARSNIEAAKTGLEELAESGD